MKKKMILTLYFLAVLVFIYGLSYGANYKMVCDDLDQTDGKGISTNYKLMVSAGGQSSPIGSGSSTNYKLMAGYVGATFVQRGDVNADGVINVTDVVYLINYKFLVPPGPPPIPWEAGDPNCDGVINVTDVVYLINYKFLVPPGPPPCDP
jgi:hypothetical protein